MALLATLSVICSLCCASGAAFADAGDAAPASATASSTTLPVKEDGTSVTWEEVRRYIDDNFTGSKVFADAVYDAIYASGQDYTKTRAHNAADVIKYFGSPNSNGKITITKPLEDDAVLTGILLLTRTATLTIENVGSWKSLGFIEDAYKEVETEPFPWDKDLGPAVIVQAIGISELPRNPYQLNLTRTLGGNNHNFQTTAYNELPVTLLRHSGSGSTQIAIDTTLTGRAANVDLSSVVASRGSDNAIHPTELESYFRNDLTGQAEETDRISTNGNIVTISVPNDGQDGRYDEQMSFHNLYNWYANVTQQHYGIDYFYRADVTYLNTVKIESNDTVLSDLSFQKVDATTGKPIPDVQFRVYADEGGTQIAQQAVVKDGKVQLKQDGSIIMQDTGIYTTDSNGEIKVPYMPAGKTYYVKEVAAPAGYQMDSKSKPVKVTANATVTDADVLNGEGKSAEVLNDKNTAVADNFKDARNWEAAEGNIRLTSKKQQISVDHGVYIKNGGNSVTLNDASVTGDGVQLLSGAPTYTMTDSDGTKGTFKTLQDAQAAINKLIAKKKLDADNAVITVNTGKRVYYAPGKNASETQVTNKKLPVYIQPSVTKLLSGDAVLGEDESKTFTFRLSGEGVDQTASVELKKTDKDASSVGTATFDMLKYDANALGMDANGQPVTDKTFTYKITEESGDDPDVTYNPDGVYYEMAVHVTALDGTTSDGYGYRAEVTVTKVATDKDGVEHKTQVFNRAFTSKETNGNPTDDKGNVTYQPKPGQVKTEDFKFQNVLKPSFEFVKTDGDNYKFLLQGATFSLFRCNSENCPADLVDWRNGSNVGPDKAWSVFATQTSGTNGKIKFSGLADGEYRLVETKAPSGYTLPAGQWRVIVKEGSIERPEAIKDKDGNPPPAFHTDDKNGGLLGLGNNKHMSVPSTGGRGLIVFASLGGALLLAGVTVLSAEARRKANLQ